MCGPLWKGKNIKKPAHEFLQIPLVSFPLLYQYPKPWLQLYGEFSASVGDFMDMAEQKYNVHGTKWLLCVIQEKEISVFKYKVIEGPNDLPKQDLDLHLPCHTFSSFPSVVPRRWLLISILYCGNEHSSNPFKFPGIQATFEPLHHFVCVVNGSIQSKDSSKYFFLLSHQVIFSQSGCWLIIHLAVTDVAFEEEIGKSILQNITRELTEKWTQMTSCDPNTGSWPLVILVFF